MTHVVHLSHSAIAGAPGMLAAAQSALGGHTTVHFRFGDHAPGRALMSASSYGASDNPVSAEVFREAVEQADLVHVHNRLPRLALSWLAQIRGALDLPFVYQVHSSVGERPLYVDVSDEHPVRWSARLCVAQAHPRMYPDHVMVPNCLYRAGIDRRPPRRVADGEPLRILYSPSSNAVRRWSAKSSPAFADAMRYLRRQRWAQVTTALEVPPEQLVRQRRVHPVQIDEVVTGGFHLVSYEAMATGGVAVNGADDEAIAALRAALRTDDVVPFRRAEPRTVFERILELERDRDLLHEERLRSHRFFWDHLDPARVVKLFDEIYAASA